VATDREQRLQFLGLTDRDVTLLQALRPVFEHEAVAWAGALYQHLLEFADTKPLVLDHTTQERLKGLLRAYLLRVVEGSFDDAYVADRQRMGQTHERIGLAPRWHVLAYARCLQLMVPAVYQHFAATPDQACQAVMALEKVFLLDTSFAVDAYVTHDRHRHRQFLDSIVRDTVDCIFLFDANKRFRVWNPAAERVLGWTASEVLGQSVQLIIPPERLAAGELQWLDDQIALTGHAQLETERLTRDGRRVPVEMSVSLLRGPAGEPIGRCAILRDITSRKRLEEEKLQSERLATIGAMSAKLAHEIRNPLSSIRLNLDLVGDEVGTLAATSPEPARVVRELLRIVDAEVHRIQRVTEDYLQFAKMPKPRWEVVALNDVLTQRLAFLQSLFTKSHIQLVTDFAPELPAIAGDEEQLWQAILNLVRNALEAMPEGGTLTVRTAHDAGHVRLAITDTGKGMGVAEREQLFKPFFSTKPGGTGLGLPLTQQIIAEHNGRLTCESVPGQGTTFTIELPLTESPSHAPQS
jgi:PAS domain S-box-containing protein